MPTVQGLRIVAMSLSMPTGTHVNRLPIQGILTFCDQVSTNAPEGTNGKRIILQRAAAERALPSLMGMGIDVSEGLTGHNSKHKIGVISSARLDGNAVAIEGHLFCSDFKVECAQIQRDKANLGFSFEAQAISVQDLAADVLTITGLQFTGAAVLKRSNAAYEMTSLAAARDRGYGVVDQLADASMIGRKPSNADIAATRHLIQAMQRAGVTPPHPGAKLTAAQMDAVLAGQQTISERMAIRMLVHQAGIEPMAAR